MAELGTEQRPPNPAASSFSGFPGNVARREWPGGRACALHPPRAASLGETGTGLNPVSLPPAQGQDISVPEAGHSGGTTDLGLLGAFMLSTDFHSLSKRFFGSKGFGRELLLNSCACVSLAECFCGKSKRISSPLRSEESKDA